MVKPAPLKKIEELGLLLNGVNTSGVISEFQYARFSRLLRESKETTPTEWWNMMKSLVEVYADNLEEAKTFAEYNLSSSESLQILRNAHFVFNRTFSLENAVRAVEKIAHITNKLGKDLKENLPQSFELDYLLTGNIRKLNFQPYEEKAPIIDFFAEMQKQLEITDEALAAISNIVHEVILSFKAQCFMMEYSYIDEEFLLVIYIKKAFSVISDINTTITYRCLEAGLLDDFNKISYLFLPYDEHTHD